MSDYTIIQSDEGYRISYKGFPTGPYYETEDEATELVEAWTGPSWEQKELSKVDFVPEMYGFDYNPKEDSNEQGEP